MHWLKSLLYLFDLPPYRLKKRPVAWRVRDCADGWILYDNEKQAYWDANQRGAQMQGLYVRDVKSGRAWARFPNTVDPAEGKSFGLMPQIARTRQDVKLLPNGKGGMCDRPAGHAAVTFWLSASHPCGEMMPNREAA